MATGASRSPLAARRVVVTAGGTRQPLDDVRVLTNTSSGRFGARLAEECLRRGALVDYVHGRGALLPFHERLEIDLRAGHAAARALVDALCFEENGESLTCHEVGTVDEALACLRTLLTSGTATVIVHAMAVSDYTAAARHGKISSDEDELVLRLQRAPKLIAQFKTWAPGIVQVGFKLLSGVPAAELYRVGLDSGRRYGSDLTIANDLRAITGDRHPVVAIWPGGAREEIAVDAPRRVIDLVEDLVRARGQDTGKD